SLDGLEYATNIESLSLNLLTGVGDLSPIEGLVSLRQLDLHGWMDGMPRLTTIDSLAGLIGLKTLRLGRLDRITDLRPLAGLAGLRKLQLHEMPAGLDLEYLAVLGRLKVLEIDSPWGKAG